VITEAPADAVSGWTKDPVNPAVFLDRDGVINRDSPDYITSLSAFEFLPRSLEAIARLTRTGFAIFVVTNQSGINRGYISTSTLEEIHRFMRHRIEAEGGRIRDIFCCPHLPEENCACRKPKPGMILSARKRYGMDLNKAVMIGDRSTDIACGKNAGCGSTIQVRCEEPMDLPTTPLDPKPDFLAQDLFEAVSWLLSRHVP
jgi:D-glycero-D-manno-heptose 1,7-bisphosphate phosphatase